MFDVPVGLTLKLHLMSMLFRFQISALAYSRLLEKIITTTQNGIRASVTSCMLRQCYVIYFIQKNRTIDSRKTSISQEWFVIESCPTPH